MPSSFIHLHNHSEFSLLDGACHVTNLVQAAVRQGMDAVALTDHGNLFGVVKFYDEATKKGIKPIIGCEVYLAPGKRFDRGEKNQKEVYHHLILLARNNTGYRNLLRLASLAYTEGFYYKPRVDKEILEQYSQGLFCLTACLKGEIPYNLTLDRKDKAKILLEEYLRIFEPGSVFLELMENGLSAQNKANQGLVELAKEMGVPLVATNDVHYIEPEDAEAHDILLCVQTGKLESDPDRMRYESRDFYFKSPQQMEAAFADHPEAIANTRLIADACNVEIELGKMHRPEYSLPEDYQKSDTEYLRELVEEGARERYPEMTETVRQRMDYEMSVIQKMGYEGYFLIVWDFIRFARQRGIAVGPGRGSAAGSIVAYCLGITDLDPLEHGLLFERFLNPDRISMPDIDVDFSDKRREEVIRYVADKYGLESVAQIATFGTLGAKMVVRDVGRALGYPASECNRVAKMIPEELDIKLKKALEQSEELREWKDSDPRNARLLEISMRLEGLCRQSSTHAAGIVIAKGDLRDYTPLMKTNKGEIACQFEMKSIEKLGLLKMDFLGLRTLSIIEDTLGFLHQQGIELDLKTIPMDDPATYALLSEARTNGVFQLESSGMKDILRKLRPEVFSDLVAVVALYRPGPLGSGMVDDFIRRKRGEVEITYDHPALEPILKETYGIIVYQEQVMQIAHVISGYTLAEADSMRRAMGKKDRELMDKMLADFVERAVAQGVERSVADKIARLIGHFAGYGFNKSHSAAYAVITYQTAYLKTHYSTEFMAALLTNEINNTDRIVRFVNDCRQMGIELLPPCVNESVGGFIVRERSIRFGLSGIKNVGTAAINSIIKCRNQDGEFTSLLDFCERVELSAVNSKVLECLVRAGAMDCFGRKRAELLALLPEAQERASGIQRDRNAGQTSLFEAVPIEKVQDLPHLEVEELPKSELLKAEKQLLGVYLSGHPLWEYQKELELFASMTTAEIAGEEEISAVRLAGIITQITRKNTKNGDRMALLTLEDLEGQVEVVVFPDLYASNLGLLQEERVVVITGDGSKRGEGVSVRASQIWSIEQAWEQLVRGMHLYFNLSENGETQFTALRNRLALHRGRTRLYLHLNLSDTDQVTISAGDQYLVRPGPDLTRLIKEIAGTIPVTYDVNGVSPPKNNGRRTSYPEGKASP